MLSIRPLHHEPLASGADPAAVATLLPTAEASRVAERTESPWKLVPDELTERPHLSIVSRPSDAPPAPHASTAPFAAPRVSVVIPAWNEAKNLPHVLPRIPRWVHEVLIVDGESTDGTPDVARELWPTCRIVAQEGRGKGAALRSGFKAATGDIIVMLDADGSMDPAEIPMFVSALRVGSDFAKGSRFVQGGGTSDMSFVRQLGNWGLLMVMKLFFGSRYSDLCYGYNAFWRRVLEDLDLDCDGFEIETLMNVRALQAGLKVTEVPSFESERIHGESRLRAIPDGMRVLRTICREWWRGLARSGQQREIGRDVAVHS